MMHIVPVHAVQDATDAAGADKDKDEEEDDEDDDDDEPDDFMIIPEGLGFLWVCAVQIQSLARSGKQIL